MCKFLRVVKPSFDSSRQGRAGGAGLVPRRNRVDPLGDLHAVPQRHRVPRLASPAGPAAPLDPAVLPRRRGRLGGQTSPVCIVPARCLPHVSRCVDDHARPRQTGPSVRDQCTGERLRLAGAVLGWGVDPSASAVSSEPPSPEATTAIRSQLRPMLVGMTWPGCRWSRER